VYDGILEIGKVYQLQRLSIKIISKEDLLEKLDDRINFSVNHTIQKFPSIVQKIALCLQTTKPIQIDRRKIQLDNRLDFE